MTNNYYHKHKERLRKDIKIKTKKKKGKKRPEKDIKILLKKKKKKGVIRIFLGNNSKN